MRKNLFEGYYIKHPDSRDMAITSLCFPIHRRPGKREGVADSTIYSTGLFFDGCRRIAG